MDHSVYSMTNGRPGGGKRGTGGGRLLLEEDRDEEGRETKPYTSRSRPYRDNLHERLQRTRR